MEMLVTAMAAIGFILAGSISTFWLMERRRQNEKIRERLGID